MDQDLVDKLKTLTGQDDDGVKSMLDGASIDQMYGLIDAARKNDTAAMQKAIAPLKNNANNGNAASQDGQTQPQTQPAGTTVQSTTAQTTNSSGDDTSDGSTDSQAKQPSNSSSDANKTHPTTTTATDVTNAGSSEQADDVEEDMKNKHLKPIKVAVPKPQDTEAKELATNPLFRPKKEPSKKERLARKDSKHKGRMFDSFDPKGDGPLNEGVMGMSIMPAIKKMLTLAGRPVNEEEIQKAMEDFMGDFGDPRELSINDIAEPVGTTIPAGPLDGALAALAGGDVEAEFDADMDAMPVDGEDHTGAAYGALRQAAETIKQSLGDLTIGEFVEARRLISEIQSMMDHLANSTK